VLLPDWNSAPTWKEIVGKAIDPDKELPEQWQPELAEARSLEETDAIAFPTPFAWAEMMSAVIRQNLFGHLLFKYYEDLFLGLVLGKLQLEILDLKGFDLGQVLSDTDDRYRYFGLLRGVAREPEIQGKVFGATGPESVLWPSPRRTDGEWRKLREAIQTETHLSAGYQMLADLRDLMRLKRMWQPNEVPWMRGLDHIIRDLKGSENARLFHLHSRMAGPVLATFGGRGMRPLYLPVYEEGFAAELSRALTGSFKQREGAVVIFDDKNREQYEIRLPHVAANGDLLLGGGGTIRVPDRAGRISEFNTSRLPRLENDERGDGLNTLLQPLEEAMRKDQKLYRAVSRAPEDIRQEPYFYPDVMRIPVARLGPAAISGTEVTFSSQAYQLVFDKESFGLPPLGELQSDAAGTTSFILDHAQGGVSKKQVFLETYKGRVVSDLTTLGWVLWAYFIGKVSWQGDRFQDEELTPVMIAGKGERLLDLTGEAYRKAAEKRDQHRRLATLQRFLRNYADRANQSGANDLSRLCRKASQAFVEAVWPDQSVIENGYPGQWQAIDVGGVRLDLARDVRDRRA
jgi:hypothetical protein